MFLSTGSVSGLPSVAFWVGMPATATSLPLCGRA